MQLKPIGVIRSCFASKFGTPRQGVLSPSSWAELILDPQVCPTGVLHDLDQYSHLWLIAYFHQSGDNFSQGKIHPPRLNGKKVGVFASRSPHRPNPLGLTLARIEEVQERSVLLSHVDLIDQTPVLDIKPYIPEFDALPNARIPEWLKQSSEAPEIAIIWNPDVQREVAAVQAQRRWPAERFFLLVEEMLRSDPRPRVYRDMPEKIHIIQIEDWDFHFRWQEDHFEVFRVVNLSK